jgi:hypothetical protein
MCIAVRGHPLWIPGVVEFGGQLGGHQGMLNWPKTVSRWAKEGKLPLLRTLGGHRRYSATEIRQLADELQVLPAD